MRSASFQLQPVPEAFYLSKDRSTGTHPCLPNTHVPALRAIRDWVNFDSQPIFWLRGLAGSGKSSIAFTVAQDGVISVPHSSSRGHAFPFAEVVLSFKPLVFNLESPRHLHFPCT